MAAITTIIVGILSYTSLIYGRPSSRLYERLLLETLYPGKFNQVQYRNTEPSLDAAWSLINRHLGQVGGVAVDPENQPYVFHRGSRVWDGSSFIDNTFANPGDGPIKEKTIVKLDKTSGQIIDSESFGADQFYMPHGLTIDNQGNTWVTDVALHQVMKIPKGSHNATLVLGEKLVPGSDDTHFCKPTDVAVASNGDFFVSDGYCNGRIIKFSPDGKIIKQWGREGNGELADSFSVPHSLTLIESMDMICVADREHGRVQCFKAGLKNPSNLGQFSGSYGGVFGAQVFAVEYCKDARHGDVLYLVNGDRGNTQPLGFTVSVSDGRILERWAPGGNGFGQPHDVTASPDGTSIYVGDIYPNYPPLTKFNRN